jgi:type VI secretion system protein ImpK
MSVSISNEAFLAGQFRDFYNDVIRLKQLIKDRGGMWVDEPVAVEKEPANGNGHGTNLSITGPLPRIDPVMLQTLSGSEQITSLAVRGSVDRLIEPSAELTPLTVEVWKKLIDRFRGNGVELMRAGKSSGNYLQAQYVMAVFADDVFIHLDWEGNRAWTSNLLEAELFNSHVGGEKFFDKLDLLLRDRAPADRSLAAVYLNALSLGFRGKYYGINDHGKLRRYRHELFAFIFRQPADLLNDARVAFPDSYVQTLRTEKTKKLTNPRVWLAVFAMVLFAYLAVSHGLWLKLTARLDRANQRIVEIEKRLNSLPPPLN